ncbi:MAG: 3-phosphoshikimate 1-carboxyvinyltransferase [Phoenicibacter congonensis]|uniref:3-phosphoshikimate 1-carboxyvinyltransferase n=1 Tax=Phoenicibacter congonensis TaxID=1944646 RepID=A0AA43U905_9ACTN|nr:3-phosphoshikimate 1-carboxyvinyltransferase [Phoenicibacter congonensis]
MTSYVEISPLSSPISGSIRVSGDKSISHRSILFSAMCEGTSKVTGVLNSDDVQASIEAVHALGAKVDLAKQPDGSLSGTITGWGAEGPKQPDGPIDCHNSGTTARLLMGILAPWDIEVEITGDESLCSRPMRRITAPLMLMGAKFSPDGAENLPITIHGNKNLKAIQYDSPMASAQLKSAVLLAGVSANGTTSVTEPAQSRTHTELMLSEYGVETVANTRFASVEGPVQMQASDLNVPGDASSAAFLCCLAVLLKGSELTVEHVLLSASRTGFLRTLERMGANIEWVVEGSEGKEVYGSIHVKYSPNIKGCEIPAKYFATVIDEVPILALVASHAKGITVFRGCEELRAKESDRLDAIIDGLTELGASAWTHGDDLFIEGDPDFELPDGLRLPSNGDHRMAITWAIAGMVGKKPIEVEDFDCVSVSYPNFIEDVTSLTKGE